MKTFPLDDGSKGRFTDLTNDEDSYLWSLIHTSLPMTPEKTLILAVLEDAIHCIERCPSEKLVADAVAWIEDTEDNEYVFTFENCCSALGLNASVVRKLILERCPIKRPSIEYAKAS
jgi:hypothetical protein